MNSTSYIGRFAPSPTGPLHFGSLVACLASYLDCRANHGKWLVRIEDLDAPRCQAEFADDILATMRAFGFNWDRDVLSQSRRGKHYESALRQLSDATYACACSRKEIADSGLNGIEGPVYPGTCRALRLDWRGNAVRIRATGDEICFVDRVQGKICQHLERDVGDFVLRRRDGLFAYQLAVVVDDANQQVSHVVRGADLLDSTPRQIYLQHLLGVRTPVYLHIPVVTSPQGQKLSKQSLAPAIDAREASALLVRAMAFLGQPTAWARDIAQPAKLLAGAVVHWNVAKIPGRRASHIS